MDSKQFMNKIRSIEKEILDDIVKVCDDANISYFLDGGTLLGSKRHEGYIPWDDDIDIAIFRENWNDFESLIINKLSDKYIIQSERGSVKIDTLRVHLKVNYRNSYIYDDNTDAYQNFPTQDQHLFVDVFCFSNVPESKNLTTFIWMILYGISMFKEGRPRKVKKLIEEKTKNKIFSTIYIILYPILYLIFMFLSFFEQKILEYYFAKGKDSNIVGFDISLWRNKPPIRIPKNIIYPVRKKSALFENTMYSEPNNWEKYLEMRYGEWKKLPPQNQRVFHHFKYLDFDDENLLEDKKS